MLRLISMLPRVVLPTYVVYATTYSNQYIPLFKKKKKKKKDGKADGRGRHSPNRVGEAGPEPNMLSLLGFKKAEMATGVSWAVAGAGVERIASTILTGRGRG